MRTPVRLRGLGSYFPSKVRRNEDFAYLDAGVAQERVERSGVLQRRWAEPSQTILDLAEKACTRALDSAGLRPRLVDRLILVTSTFQPGSLVPSGAVVLQDRLGLSGAQSTTVLDTCCGSLVAMDLGAALLRAGQAENVLIVASETFSKTFNPTSPVTFEIGMGMGDGAGAVVLSASPGAPDGLLASFLRSSSDFQSGLGMRPVCDARDDRHAGAVAFGSNGMPPTWRGKPIARDGLVEALQWFTSTTVPAAAREVLSRLRSVPDDIDFFVLHQPNRVFLDAWKREIGVPSHKTLDTLATLGNLSSVSVIANLDAAWCQGRIKPGDKVLMASAGEGAVWGAMVWRWSLPAPPQQPEHGLP